MGRSAADGCIMGSVWDSLCSGHLALETTLWCGFYKGSKNLIFCLVQFSMNIEFCMKHVRCVIQFEHLIYLWDDLLIHFFFVYRMGTVVLEHRQHLTVSFQSLVEHRTFWSFLATCCANKRSSDIGFKILYCSPWLIYGWPIWLCLCLHKILLASWLQLKCEGNSIKSTNLNSLRIRPAGFSFEFTCQKLFNIKWKYKIENN